ncbi:MAG: helix-turn-helix transcriptional regulator [Gammaproteobacteria bacterium]|nr:helix-turn-helix transcriptional regulator [Gammaproteobacteria bacterium]
MNKKVQIIYENGKPAYAVLRYEDYAALTGREQANGADDELVPFAVGDFIRNPIRVLRVEAGLRQEHLAVRLGVSQGYVSRIEGRNFKVTDTMVKRVKQAVNGHKR